MAKQEASRRAPSRHWWVPVVWIAYGAAYVAVFLARGQVTIGVVAAAVIVAVGAGLGHELRQPSARRPRLLGWQQDERQGQIHLRAAAAMGWVAAVGVLIASFTEFALDRSPVLWGNALGVLILGYLGGLVYYARRT